MISTLKNSKARLSELVEKASRGEEVIITVRGKPKARLCPIPAVDMKARRAWIKRLKEDAAKWSIGVHDSSQKILDELRADRL